ncbi:MAG: preprotein translocase subunit SecY [Akkermansia sp.]|nr:preprotein translocase subunit SecY [Akkermansia sp.]MBR5875477.1 preprotein translocase subunit SecY [Akkermansia sp.]
MITAFANTMKVPDLRSRILFTLAMIVIVRLGVHLPLPGVDVEALKNYMDVQAQKGDNPLGALGAILTIFSGGGLQQCGIFALGIMPYISASIMTQLMGAVIPSFKKMLREEGGRQKMTKVTRILAIIIAVIQGYLLTLSLRNPANIGLSGLGDLVLNPGFVFTTTTIFIIVTGTMFLMWIGDQITDRGIGNGVSLIISVNIISALPGAFAIAWTTLVGSGTEINPLGSLLIVALILFMVLVVALVVTITQAQRRIPVQQAKRMVGRKVMNGGTQYLPLKLNYSGVMPVIFATAILALPIMVVRQIWGDASDVTHVVSVLMSPTDVGYYIISAIMIFFFSYFWVATMFQPQQISEDMQRSGSYIPGVRPGQPTATYLDQTMSRLTFAGSLFLTLIYFLPCLLSVWGGLNMVVTQFFGGTSLLILVGVLLDVMRQVEATLLQKNYDGFMKKSRNRSKYSHLQGGNAESSTGLVALWLIIAVFVLAGAVIMAM